MGTKELQRRKEYSIQKRWEEVLTEFSHASFSLVFTVNITKQDKTPPAIRRSQFERIDQQLQAEKPF
jgi:hypothetical protein